MGWDEVFSYFVFLDKGRTISKQEVLRISYPPPLPLPSAPLRPPGIHQPISLPVAPFLLINIVLSEALDHDSIAILSQPALDHGSRRFFVDSYGHAVHDEKQ